MNLRCPKCNQQLPEVETLEYRFCLHCGADISSKPVKLDEAYLTIPPDSSPPQVDRKPDEINTGTGETLSETGPLDDQTIAPQPSPPQNRPPIRPPAEPAPATFFRTPPPKPDLPPPISKKLRTAKPDLPPSLPEKKPQTNHHHKVIIAVLIILALVILILGGLFTF